MTKAFALNGRHMQNSCIGQHMLEGRFLIAFEVQAFKSSLHAEVLRSLIERDMVMRVQGAVEVALSKWRPKLYDNVMTSVCFLNKCST